MQRDFKAENSGARLGSFIGDLVDGDGSLSARDSAESDSPSLLGSS